MVYPYTAFAVVREVSREAQPLWLIREFSVLAFLLAVSSAFASKKQTFCAFRTFLLNNLAFFKVFV